MYNRHNNDAPPGAVYVGRPSKWGNMFMGMARAEMVRKHKEWIEEQVKLGNVGFGKQFKYNLDELRGKDLICWCAPLPCHGDTWLELANAEKPAREPVEKPLEVEVLEHLLGDYDLHSPHDRTILTSSVMSVIKKRWDSWVNNLQEVEIDPHEYNNPGDVRLGISLQCSHDKDTLRRKIIWKPHQ